MVEDEWSNFEVINAVKALSSQIADLTRTVNMLRREIDHIPVRSCQLARRLEEKNNPPTKGETHG